MIQSMTGFGSKEKAVGSFGKMSVELRSSNHKFFEVVFHMPEGLLSLEGKVKKEIEAKVRRGRVTCVINILGARPTSVCINKKLLSNYFAMLKSIRKEFHIQDEPSINTLIHLPGVLSVEENRLPKENLWPSLKVLVNLALDGLVKMRKKEGQATFGFLKHRADSIMQILESIQLRFKKVIKDKISRVNMPEERANLLKDTDISEEIERLVFHTRNFKHKLFKDGPVGKELDFIAQEMQREANTLGAKSFDAAISAKVVQIKSQIEKIREQVQNVE